MSDRDKHLKRGEEHSDKIEGALMLPRRSGKEIPVPVKYLAGSSTGVSFEALGTRRKDKIEQL